VWCRVGSADEKGEPEMKIVIDAPYEIMVRSFERVGDSVLPPGAVVVDVDDATVERWERAWKEIAEGWSELDRLADEFFMQRYQQRQEKTWDREGT
jgi:hypothetical protein